MKMLMEEFHNRISVPALVLLPVVTPNLNRDLPKPQTLIKAIMEIMVEEEVGVAFYMVLTYLNPLIFQAVQLCQQLKVSKIMVEVDPKIR